MTCRLGGPEGIPASPDYYHGGVDVCLYHGGVGDDINLFIILGLCGKHDEILSAAHTMPPVIEAFFPCYTQSVVDALEI